MKKGAPFYAKQLLALYEEGPINDDGEVQRLRKERFHLLARSLLRTLADALCITQYNVLSNTGGRFIIGDVTLRSDTTKIKVVGSYIDEERVVCMEQRDGQYFSEMRIVHLGLKDFDDYDAVLKKFMELLPEEE